MQQKSEEQREGKTMNSIRVKFEQAKDIVDFVKTASKYSYDIDVRCGSIVVDAKSLVGVMAIRGGLFT